MKPTFTILVVTLLLLTQAGCGSKNKQAAANTDSSNISAGPTEGSADAGVHPEAQRLFEQGNELARQDKDAEAAEAFKQAVAVDPNFAEAHLRLAMSYDVLDQKKEAEEEYKRAAEIYQKSLRQDSKDAKAFFNMGLAYNKLAKPDEAAKAFRQAVKLEPENDDYQYELGLSLGHVAQYQEAVMALQKAIDINPDNYRAQEALERAKIDLQRWQSMVKQQQEIAARRQAASNKNVNSNTSSNTSTVPTPKPEVH